jgi:excisionase family DNA binding protein
MAPIAVNDKRATMSVDETAKVLGVSRDLIYASVRDGSIASIRLGGRILIPRREVLALLGEEAEQAGA